ncbi:hypothetical protein EVAR_24157_1 [Eumeta japonica]|uniref:Uncharacterized protein n=1 Tax=Eumeta variegata TaxID=151549 RepID=A0A4C1W714_EUMVA|nr:hypothetical protein EVAR_24157_1 [Eumeta japonica]
MDLPLNSGINSSQIENNDTNLLSPAHADKGGYMRVPGATCERSSDKNIRQTLSRRNKSSSDASLTVTCHGEALQPACVRACACDKKLKAGRAYRNSTCLDRRQLTRLPSVPATQVGLGAPARAAFCPRLKASGCKTESGAAMRVPRINSEFGFMER